MARISTVERVSEKEGRSGPLVFVTVGHRYEDGSGLLLEEEQDLVYREHYATREQARRSIFEYIEVFYNRRRLHSSLGYKSPEAFEAQIN